MLSFVLKFFLSRFSLLSAHFEQSMQPLRLCKAFSAAGQKESHWVTYSRNPVKRLGIRHVCHGHLLLAMLVLIVTNAKSLIPAHISNSGKQARQTVGDRSGVNKGSAARFTFGSLLCMVQNASDPWIWRRSILSMFRRLACHGGLTATAGPW